MLEITKLTVKDVRFPTSLSSHGSDAMHTDPDYSCAYVILDTSDHDMCGYGLSFTIGRGTEIVVQAVRSLSHLVVGKKISNIFSDFAKFWRKLTSESQLRWIGPEKGAVHLAVAAIVNALWDLWARMEKKPLWKLLTDMPPEKLVSTIDFRYVSKNWHVPRRHEPGLLTWRKSLVEVYALNTVKGIKLPLRFAYEEAMSMLQDMRSGKDKRQAYLDKHGYPAYTTQAGWLGYSSETVKGKCMDLMQQGFTAFKIKVGQDLDSDKARCHMLRKLIGPDNLLMVDANQRWEVQEAIDWMRELAPFKPLWIEEPTSPDDILGHATIAKALAPHGIGVATGEMCCNRIMFKQFLQAKGLNYCQIDSCRLGGVNEILCVYLMAKKVGMPVCPHAGGVGLCEMVQHLQIFDYLCISGSMEHRMIEHVGEEHEHFETPIVMKRAAYQVPTEPGYGTKFKADILEKYEYPTGTLWLELFDEEKFPRPQ